MAEPTKLPVIFRKERDGTIVAVFPTLPADYQGRDMTSYVRVGQHGSASWTWYLTGKHTLAKPSEYEALLKELQGIYGYSHVPNDPVFTLVPVRRITRRHRDEYDAALRAVRESLRANPLGAPLAPN